MIELLAVLAIMALIAGLVAPTLTQFRQGDATLAATRQMLDAVARARQLAISQHTTVYMVFVPTNFWSPYTPDQFLQNMSPAARKAVSNVLDKPLIGYGYLSLHTVGDQPGRSTPRYLASWQSLPEGSFIPLWKFDSPIRVSITNPASRRIYDVYAFDTNLFPFPTEEAFYQSVDIRRFVTLPFIAFNYLGQPVSVDGKLLDHDLYIPLARGSVLVQRDETKAPVMYDLNPPTPGPQVREVPADNSRVNFNLIHIDRLTGRAQLEHREIQ